MALLQDCVKTYLQTRGSKTAENKKDRDKRGE